MNNVNTNNTTIWCDMDGVVAIYKPDGFYGKKPPFLIPNGHYFQNCLPDNKIINTLCILHNIYNIKIKIISNVHETLKQEHSFDKYKWIEQYMPFINVEKDYHPITMSKTDYVKKIKKKDLTKFDILISDFNKDLIPWSENGGTGIKYANGLNNPHSYNGIYIPEEYNTKQIANQIIDTIYKLNRKD